jgi:hypothetical protein
MSGSGMNSASVIQRQRELAGQRAAISVGEEDSSLGQPFKVIVVASDGQGGQFQRATTIEMLKRRNMPYIVRQVD